MKYKFVKWTKINQYICSYLELSYLRKGIDWKIQDEY